MIGSRKNEVAHTLLRKNKYYKQLLNIILLKVLDYQCIFVTKMKNMIGICKNYQFEIVLPVTHSSMPSMQPHSNTCDTMKAEKQKSDQLV